jgi:hypothetical protein
VLGGGFRRRFLVNCPYLLLIRYQSRVLLSWFDLFLRCDVIQEIAHSIVLLPILRSSYRSLNSLATELLYWLILLNNLFLTLLRI